MVSCACVQFTEDIGLLTNDEIFEQKLEFAAYGTFWPTRQYITFSSWNYTQMARCAIPGNDLKTFNFCTCALSPSPTFSQVPELRGWKMAKVRGSTKLHGCIACIVSYKNSLLSSMRNSVCIVPEIELAYTPCMFK